MRRDERFQPILVTAHLAAPVVLDGTFFGLDAALMRIGINAAHVPHKGKLIDWHPIPVGTIKYPHRPPCRDGHPDFVFCCSWPIADWREELREVHYYVKRYRDRLAAEYGEPFSRKRDQGRWRDWRIPLMTWSVPTLSWFMFASPRKVAKMVSKIPALGKKRSQGYGIVRKWEVVTVPHDWSVVGPDGQLMRTVPELPQGVDPSTAIRTFAAYRPPYWAPERHAEVWAPAKPLGLDVLEKLTQTKR